MRKVFGLALLIAVVSLGWTAPVYAGVQYSNDFENPSSTNVTTAWPEWVLDSSSGFAQAVNGRIEWDASGGNNDWVRLNREVPTNYTFEFDLFLQEGRDGRFSVWPFCNAGDTYTRYNYFVRKNTHFFNGADTVPSEGPCDMTLPLGSNPNRVRVEVTGNHVLFLYKKQGVGGWILIDERDFPAIESPRYIMLGHNSDDNVAGLFYVDNFVLSYPSQNLMNYSNNFDAASSADVTTNWPEWVIYSGGSMKAANGRIEWDATGGNNDWVRLNKELPANYVVEFDFFYQADHNGRFSVWPFCKDGDGIFERYNYFLRKNSHFFNGADTVPSEGSFDMTLPLGANPHRLRVEVTGNHVLLLYKNQGAGGWILIDERDFPAVENPRYFQLGYNSDDGVAGQFYIDNISLIELASNRATVERSLGAENFVANTPVPVSLKVGVTGTIPSMTITEGIPEGWTVGDISNNGVVSGSNIYWALTNQTQSVTLTYNAIPPRLVQERVAGFSGSVDSGDGEERISGDTAISIKLPILYREAVDFDFSGSPVDGKKYPTGSEYGVRYTQGMNGVPSDMVYVRPTGDDSVPAVDAKFDFPAGADFHQGSPAMSTFLSASYDFTGYRDDGEIWLEHGASDTNANIGSIDAGDWFRYTFDLGEGNQVIILNIGLNSWHSADNFSGTTNVFTDVYVDNQFKSEIKESVTNANEFNFFSVGPIEVSGGEHSVVVAFPTAPSPAFLSRLEVVRVQGIGRVERTLTSDGFFTPGQPIVVSLKAEALYGNYTSYIEETLPANVTVSDIGTGGQLEDGKILFSLDPTTTSKTVTYTVTPPDNVRFLLFDGLCSVGLPLADAVYGDVSVTNKEWLFGTPTKEVKDDFTGTALGSSWTVEYGSDSTLATDYKDGVTIAVSDGKLTFGVDTVSEPEKFSEWSNGRRAPLILRTDIPDGDWRIETDVKLVDSLGWSNFTSGLFVAYNDGKDADVSGDEYFFGFSESELWAGLTNNDSVSGSLAYHEYTAEYDWIDSLLLTGKITAKIAITRRSGELIFSAQLPGKSWQLVGAPVTETRTPTRLGLISENWGSENYFIAEYDYFALQTLSVFTDVDAWELY